MKIGYYYKLNDKWYKSHYNKLPIVVKDCYYYHGDSTWQYSNKPTRISENHWFTDWKPQAPDAEDITIINMRFP